MSWMVFAWFFSNIPWKIFSMRYWCFMSSSGCQVWRPDVLQNETRKSGRTHLRNYLWLFQTRKTNATHWKQIWKSKLIAPQPNKTELYPHTNRAAPRMLVSGGAMEGGRSSYPETWIRAARGSFCFLDGTDPENKQTPRWYYYGI